MPAPTKVTVHTEISDESSLAVIYGKGAIADRLEEKLIGQKVKVITLPHLGDVLSILEKPAYIFFIVSGNVTSAILEEQFRGAAQSGLKARSRFVLLFMESVPEVEKSLNRIADEVGIQVTVVELQGEFQSKSALDSAAPKIIKLAFTQQNNKRQVIFGEKRTNTISTSDVAELKPLKRDPEKVLAKLAETARSQKRWSYWNSLGFTPKMAGTMILVTMVTTLFLAPFFWLGIQTALGVNELVSAKDLVIAGQFENASKRVLLAKSRFIALKDFIGPVVKRVDDYPKIGFLSDYYRFVDLLDQSTNTIQETIELGPVISQIPAAVIGSSPPVELEKTLKELSLSLPLIDEQLGLLQAKAEETISSKTISWLRFFGFSPARLIAYKELLPQARWQIGQAQQILKVLPDIVAIGGAKTYLVVFQNSAELRATGGFIGSYALVRFENGKLVGYKVSDVYTADGQLKGEVAPPDEILHYLGQSAWFMRDANFSPDFPLTAKRLEWFLQKETGQKVDGVIGVDIGAVQKLLKATGPVKISDFNDIVGAEDFYHKTQYQAEINFFPGSTKKRDYLGAVAEAIIQKIALEPSKSWIGLNQALRDSLFEKNLTVYFDNQVTQAPFSDNGWSGSLRSGYCGTSRANCLAVVESNFGFNKANFFVQRDFDVRTIIDKSGAVDVALIMRLQNNSPSEAWPGGKYKNYFRILIPTGSKFNGISLGDDRKATLSAVLTGEVIQSVPDDSFLVFHTNEQAYLENTPMASGLTSYGVLMELPVGSRREIIFHYKPPNKINLTEGEIDYKFGFLKQPGTGAPVVSFNIEFPSYLKPKALDDTGINRRFDLNKSVSGGPLIFSQRVVYNTDLAGDKFLTITFQR